MLQHLFTSYGKISAAELADNNKMIKNLFNPAQPIEALWEQVQNSIDISEASEKPYIKEKITAITYTLLNNPGEFFTAHKE